MEFILTDNEDLGPCALLLVRDMLHVVVMPAQHELGVVLLQVRFETVLNGAGAGVVVAGTGEDKRVSVCVRERERERECVCV